MGPKTDMHQNIEIRYGYSIGDDMFHAHFMLPSKARKGGFQRSVSMSMSPGLSEGKHHVKASNEADVLKNAHNAIDSYFED